ncbi:hypothetical protein JHK82_027354 [Glycine max]|uniref:Uncharacterized protein n=1 Tax=Glycine max TaxID=3847 RepID=A0A0R0HR17_SOYBN|nr:hypothetical protein JHK82_027354 [Glycine max]KAH1137376.1 hypothetical protein GYH30_027391 [Glycine max]
MSPPATVHHYISHSKPLQYVSKLLQYVSKAFPIRFPSPDVLGPFASLFLQKSQAPFFLPFSLSLISLSPIVLSPFSVPSFHFFILPIFLHFFTSKAMIFYTKIMIFISDFMTTISYLRSSPGLHFYIVFLVEEHTKV